LTDTILNIKKGLFNLAIYGSPGSQLIPTSLRLKWGLESIEGSWVKGLGFQNATVNLLDLEKRFQSGDNFQGNMEIHTKKIEDWKRNDFDFVANYLFEFAKKNFYDIKHIPAVPRRFPVILKPEELPWSARTHNALKQVDWLENFKYLHLITYEELSKIRNLGIKSILEFAVILENSIEIAEGVVSSGLIPSIFQKDGKVIEIRERPQPSYIDYKFLNSSIHDIGLSVRSRNCLANMNIKLVRELIYTSRTKLMVSRNFGRRSLKEIENCLSNKNLALGMDLMGSILKFGPATPIEVLGLNSKMNDELHNQDLTFIKDLLPLTESAITDIFPKYTLKHIKASLVICRPYLEDCNNPNEVSTEKDVETNIDLVALENMANEPWAEEVCSSDPRFGELMPFSGCLREKIEELLALAISNDLDINDQRLILILINNEHLIRQKIAELSELDLEGAIQMLIQKITLLYKETRINPIMWRYGWMGEKPLTLEEVGKIINVTRERIRQVTARFERKVRELFDEEKIFFPQIERALKVLENSQPISLENAAKLLSTKGVSKNPFHPKGLINLVEVLGQEHDFKITNNILTVGSNLNVRKILREGKRLCGYNGIANFHDIMDRVGNLAELKHEAIRKLFKNKSFGLDFIANDWIINVKTPEKRNRIINTAKAMLSVTSPLKLIDIRKGVRKRFSYRASTKSYKGLLVVPPGFVLKAFFVQHQSFEVDENDLVRYKEHLDIQKNLGGIEQVMVDVLQKSPSGMLDRKSFHKECVARGVNPNSFALISTFSPVLCHVDYNIWGLIGRNYNPASITALQRNTKQATNRLATNFGWTDDGNIWIAKELSYHQANFLMGYPVSLKRYFEGIEFEMLGEDGKIYGTIKSSKSTLYGFAPFLSRKGADEGDIIKAVFNFQNKTAELSFAQQDIFD
jgi:hypothetical protein